MKSFFSLALILVASAVFADGETGPWRSFDVKASREADLVAVLEARGITAIGWSNAVVEISDFLPLATVPLAKLGGQLTPQDPRWDPWLTGLRASFRPRDGISRLWVAPADQSKARDLLGSEVVAGGPAFSLAPPAASAGTPGTKVSPRQVTGWTFVLGALLYLVIRLVAWAASRELFRRRWIGIAVPSVLVLVGLGLVAGPLRFSAPSPAAQATVPWTRHLWYQQAWPFGASWKDWKPGKPWTYLRYERANGKITGVETSLAVPDQAWAAGAFSGLAPHHAARIFGSENP